MKILEEDIENDNSDVDATYIPNENQEDLDEETTNTATTSVTSNKIKKKLIEKIHILTIKQI
jgi:hypothetical protein